MTAHADREVLGEVTVPSGALVLIDAGLLWIWEGERDELPETIDFQLQGPDAEEAGWRFERSSTPRYWYDIPRDSVDEARQQFATFVASDGLEAELVAVPGGVPHRRRVDLALEAGGGRFGIVQFFGIQAPVVAGLPSDRDLVVCGVWMEDEELSDRWRWVALEVREGDTARTEEIGDVFVDEARLMFADADALDAWRHDEPLDGKADYVFWGRDAAHAAAAFDAPLVGSEEYGWLDLPIEEAAERGVALEETGDREGWKFAGDFRPHSHHHQVLKPMRASETGSGVIEVGGAKVCAFFTSWGDGAFPLLVDFGRADELLRLRIDLGSDETVERLRSVLGR